MSWKNQLEENGKLCHPERARRGGRVEGQRLCFILVVASTNSITLTSVTPSEPAAAGEPRGNAFAFSSYQPSLKSCQLGFVISINLIFFSLRHRLICFS